MAERPSHTPPSDPQGPGHGGPPRQSARPAARPLDRPATSGLPAHSAAPPPEPTLGDLLALLEHDPAVGLAIVDGQGRTLRSNRRFLALTVAAGGAPGANGDGPGQDHGPGEPTGPSPGQSYAQTQAQARARSTARRGVWARVGADAVRTAASDRQPVVVHFIHEGRQVQCDIWPLPGRGPDPHHPHDPHHHHHAPAQQFLVIAVEGHFGVPGDGVTPAAGSGVGSGVGSGASGIGSGVGSGTGPAEAKGGSPGQRFTTLAPMLAELGALSALTARELEVLALIGQGMATREIADTLGRSPRTIERHCDAIHKKLHTSNRVQMARYAMQAGLTQEAGKLKRV